jgi:hypothetical protein
VALLEDFEKAEVPVGIGYIWNKKEMQSYSKDWGRR